MIQSSAVIKPYNLSWNYKRHWENNGRTIKWIRFWNHNRHPITPVNEQAMGRLLWRFRSKLVALWFVKSHGRHTHVMTSSCLFIRPHIFAFFLISGNISLGPSVWKLDKPLILSKLYMAQWYKVTDTTETCDHLQPRQWLPSICGNDITWPKFFHLSFLEYSKFTSGILRQECFISQSLKYLWILYILNSIHAPHRTNRYKTLARWCYPSAVLAYVCM